MTSMAIDFSQLTIVSARTELLRGEFSAVELAEAYLSVIEEKNDAVNAYLEVFDDVLDQAQKADKRLAKEKEKSPVLTGIPIALKDNILLEGKHATAGSKILEGYVASYDAFAVSKLKEAGVVFLGRTNMDEFAMGSSTENSAYGVTKNPHDLARVSGGSSGGPAAAVTMDGALAALGSDTGGSIRQPASFCGVVGLKPTYGAVSRSGLIALGSSLDQIGPLTKTVSDAEIIFNAINGYDPMDSTSVSERQRTAPSALKRTIGVPRHFMQEGVDGDVLELFEAALKRLQDIGYRIVDVELPHISYSLPVYYIIMPAEASTNLARFDGVRYGLYKEGANIFDDYEKTRGTGFGAESRRRILLGTYVLSAGYLDAYYNKAQSVRKVIAKDFADVFNHVDAIATPTAPTPAFKIGEKNDPLSMYMSDIFTVSANIAGIPALSVPMGMVERDKISLPTGLQLMASHMHEETLFAIGKSFNKEE